MLSNNIYSYYISYSFSFLFLIAFTLFCLDNLKLSSIYFIKCFQIFSLFGLLLTIVITTYDSINTATTVSYVNDNNDVNLHGHVTLYKEAAKEIGQGLSVIGSNLGLGATIAGVSTAVAKGLVKSGMPPVQKAGVILGAGLIGGLSHSKLTIMNRNSILMSEAKENIRNNSSSDLNDLNPSINKFVDDTINSSPLQDLLLNLETTDYICLSLIGILLIQIFFKFLIKDNISLHIGNVLGKNTNSKLEYYINKIIILNKKMSAVYIILIIITLLVALSFNAYVCNDLYNNIDSYITVHNNIKNK